MKAKEQRRLEWLARITDYQSSGLTMKAWCTQNHYSIEQLKYWLRLSKRASSSPIPAPASPVPFVQLTAVDGPSESTSSLIVRIGHASIELQSGFDPKLLHDVVQVLTRSC
jgi:hypothetical protein